MLVTIVKNSFCLLFRQQGHMKYPTKKSIAKYLYGVYNDTFQGNDLTRNERARNLCMKTKSRCFKRFTLKYSIYSKISA